MRKIVCYLFALLSFSSVVSAEIQPEEAPFRKVVIVVFENQDADVMLEQPMFKELAENGAYFNKFYALYRPSQPNYFAMTAATNWNVLDNNEHNLPIKNIVDLLENRHLTWKVYAEDYPGDCFTGSAYPEEGEALYVRKHNPFISFDNIRESKRRCAKIVNAQDEFLRDIHDRNLPDYSFYIPNLVNNGHNVPGPENANTFLEYFYDKVINNLYVKRSDVLFIITFDENDKNSSEAPANLVYTLFYGTMVKPVEINHPYNFFNLVTTLEKYWRLGSLNINDKSSIPIKNNIWQCHDLSKSWCLAEENEG